MAYYSFQFMSDLHLERSPGFRVPEPPVASYLLLAGSIGDPFHSEYANFLQHCAGMFERVFVVLGAQEAYGRTIEEAARLVRAVCGRPEMRGRVTLLEAGVAYELDALKGGGKAVRVVGATLWGHVPPQAVWSAACADQDYRAIKGHTVVTGNARHAADAAWLGAEVARAEADDVGLVVVTHHAPPAVDAMLSSPVALWVHGRTNRCHRDDLHGMQLVSNQRGTAVENAVEGFDPLVVANV